MIGLLEQLKQVLVSMHTLTYGNERRRARDLGWISSGMPGRWNAITDVPGVEVGYTTLISGEGALRRGSGPVRTGVTAILPRGKHGVGHPVNAGRYSFNGNGDMTGAAMIDETGQCTMPVLISDTHGLGACHTGAVRWINNHHPRLAKEWLLPVCAETWSGYLNDINGEHVTPEAVVCAIDAAESGALAEGSVGGGTGMTSYGFKAGNGTSSRIVPFGAAAYTVGAFVQANFGDRAELTISGHRIGNQLTTPNPFEDGDWMDRDVRVPGGAGSVIVIIATDAPLSSAQCSALARRAPVGLARTGTTGSFFSGDLILAFSVANDRESDSAFPLAEPSASEVFTMEQLPWNRIDIFHTATVQAVEEAVLNSLTAATDMIGRDGNLSPAIPYDECCALLGNN